ncbi:DUF305 domain-containing protein [Acrocarpospora phusangensis]|uniref:DUF305 domain-containing protein n=1 Tax=Acrocarpospora phusangensis TaxID=1070424 RepID=UPI00195058E8|nr:DUF305 domain-containing protein [Acrocarpospora phusangensis]
MRVLAFAAFLAAGCSATADTQDPDVRFSLEMITHHRQTLKLADMVKGRSTNAYVTALAAKLKVDERTEIDVMNTWLHMWNMPVPKDAKYQMPGSVTADDYTALQSRTGEEFDRMWLSTLSRHLNTGVMIAQVAVATGDHPPTGDLARRIVREQRAEIAEIGEQIS